LFGHILHDMSETKESEPRKHPVRATGLSRRQFGLGSAWVVSGVAAFLVPSALAEWDSEKYLVYSFGQLSLRPQLEVGETYDSNVFYSEEDEVSDFILSIRPGLSLFYGQKAENFISIRYTMDAAIYAERDDLDNLGHLFSHQSRFRLARWTLQGTDSFSVTKTLLGGNFSYVQKRIGLVSLTDLWRADYEISQRMVAGVKVGFDLVDYDALDLDQRYIYDYMGYSVGTRVGYLPSDKIVVYPEFTFGQSFLEGNDPSMPQAPDVDTFSISAGAEGEFSPKLTGTISGGYELRQYSDSSDIPNGWVADFQLRWQARAKTTVSGGYRHFIQLSREARAIPYTAHRPTASVVQELGTKGQWTVAVDAYYQFNDYQGEFPDRDTSVPNSPLEYVMRTDEFLGFGFRAIWRWQPWLTFSGTYDFRQYADNMKSIPDYDLHRFSIRATAGY